MCKVMEDMRNEAAKEAARKNSIETAKSLLLLGKLTYAEIAQATKLTVDEVEELDKKKSAYLILNPLTYCVNSTGCAGGLFYYMFNGL